MKKLLIVKILQTMIKFQIKKRFTDEIIIEMEAETLKEVVEKNKANLRETELWGADLRGANLWEANLWGADLREANLWGADLRGADLRGADLRGAEIEITQKDEIIKSLGIIFKD